jgi:hypothetical protein
MLVHAANDYSTAPGLALAAELSRLDKPHLLKIFPPVGKTAAEGHGVVYTAAAQWEDEVFGFLDRHVRQR